VADVAREGKHALGRCDCNAESFLAGIICITVSAFVVLAEERFTGRGAQAVCALRLANIVR